MSFPGTQNFLDTPPLREGFQYWRSLSPSGSVPLVQDLDPIAMPTRILPWTLLYRRTRSDRYLCLQMGAGACCVFGYDPTGRHMDELLPPDTYNIRRGLFDECLHTAQPVGYGGQLSLPGMEHIPYRRLLLPVCGDLAPDHIFGLIVFPNQSSARPPDCAAEGVEWDRQIWRWNAAF